MQMFRYYLSNEESEAIKWKGWANKHHLYWQDLFEECWLPTFIEQKEENKYRHEKNKSGHVYAVHMTSCTSHHHRQLLLLHQMLLRPHQQEWLQERLLVGLQIWTLTQTHVTAAVFAQKLRTCGCQHHWHFV